LNHAKLDYLADSVDAFLTESNSIVSEQSEDLYLGFTFSFPVEQTAIDKGVLLTCESRLLFELLAFQPD
jgi:hexokinase